MKKPFSTSPYSLACQLPFQHTRSLEPDSACTAPSPAWDAWGVQQGTQGRLKDAGGETKSCGHKGESMTGMCSVWDTGCKYQTILFS